LNTLDTAERSSGSPVPVGFVNTGSSHQLQQNLGRVFDVESAEPVLRYGFVLRALDEALGLA
jgi:hypothetical protein